jgi:imidazolonepropionase
MIPAMARLLLDNARIATMRGGRYGIVERGAMLARDGRIEWVGERSERPGVAVDERIDAHGALATPALLDCHTHLVYAGHRADEFAMRLAGRTYEEISRAGGGIASTVKATRAAPAEVLEASARRRLDSLRAEGVATVEIKSGYGLDLESELKCLRVARALAGPGIDIRTTFLALHAVPPEFAGRADAYVDHVCSDVLPAVAKAGLADAVDAFCERIAFTPAQVRRVFEAARALGLRVKLHADQLSDGGGAALAAEFAALSADHLEYASDAGLDAMHRAGTVAVMLPVAFYMLRETRRPPIDSLRARGIPMAVASDCNPGTAPCASLLTAMNMACTQFGLTPEEALAGATVHAAAALGLQDRGVLEPGRRADFVLWDAETPAQLAWMVAGQRPLATRIMGSGPIGELHAYTRTGS